MILILTDPKDEHFDHVAKMLSERGAEWLQFNPADFPVRASLSLGCTANGHVRSFLRMGATTLDLTQLRSVWIRRPKVPVPHEELKEADARAVAADDCHTFTRDLWDSLRCLWLPGKPAAIRRAHFKFSQLRVAGELGLELPPTLVTNSPEEFLDFYNQHNGNIISKMAGYGLDSVARDFSRYTEVVSKRDVAYAAALQYCPVIFQAYVPKRLELRITVVGGQAFAAEIHSQQAHHSRHDWRRYDTRQTPHLAHELPPEIHERCVRLVQRLELCYGAIDMILTPDGRYVFIEVNPSGQYLWIEELTGLPISAAICDVLMAGRPAATDA